jgi:ribonuclease BN (tRNA processing enzyme)
MPCGDRNHSSYLYRLGPATLLIDCGDTVSRSYKATGLGYDLIDRLLLSHLHADHFGGFFMLLQGFWLERRRKDLPVHMPPEGVEPLRQMVSAAYLFEELLPFRMTFEPLVACKPLTQGPVTVTPHLTTHLDGLRKAYGQKHRVNYAAFSFLLEADGLRIGHTADLGGVSDLEPLVAQPLDLLVCELSHFQPEELFHFLRSCAIQHLALVHVGRRYWDRLDQTRRLAAKILPDLRVSFPRDGEVLTP